MSVNPASQHPIEQKAALSSYSPGVDESPLPTVIYTGQKYIGFLGKLCQRKNDGNSLENLHVLGMVGESIEAARLLAESLEVPLSDDLRAVIAEWDQEYAEQRKPVLIVAVSMDETHVSPPLEGIDLAIRQGWHVLFLEPLLVESEIWEPETAQAARESHWSPLGYHSMAHDFDSLGDWLPEAGPIELLVIQARLNLRKGQTELCHPLSPDACIYDLFFSIAPFVNMPEQVLASGVKRQGHQQQIDSALCFSFGELSITLAVERLEDDSELPDEPYFSFYLKGRHGEKRLQHQASSWLDRAARQLDQLRVQKPLHRAAVYADKSAAFYQAMQLSLTTGNPVSPEKFLKYPSI